MAYKVIWENQGVSWEFSGVVSFQEIHDVTIKFSNNERSDSAIYQILDCSNIDVLQLTHDEIEHIAALNKGASYSLKYLKMAFVCKNPQVKKVYQDYINFSKSTEISWLFAIFENIENAKVWVNS